MDKYYLKYNSSTKEFEWNIFLLIHICSKNKYYLKYIGSTKGSGQGNINNDSSDIYWMIIG